MEAKALEIPTISPAETGFLASFFGTKTSAPGSMLG